MDLLLDVLCSHSAMATLVIPELHVLVKCFSALWLGFELMFW